VHFQYPLPKMNCYSSYCYKTGLGRKDGVSLANIRQTQLDASGQQSLQQNVPTNFEVSSPPLLPKQRAESNLLERVDFFRLDAGRKLSPDHKAALGQFLTPPATARFMGSLFEKRPTSLHLLDAGAGVGSLSAAFVAHICTWEKKPLDISITAYEIDPILAEYVSSTLEMCRIECERVGIQFIGRVQQQDFVTVGIDSLQKGLFAPEFGQFNCAILNPPYHKIKSDSTTRKLLRTVGIETSNLYTAFLWIVIRLLAPDGELVAITPRSFCNGPYFKKFRKAFLEMMTLRRVHILNTRDQAFQEDEVLQENMIFCATKDEEKAEKVIISTSTDAEYSFPILRKVGYDQIVQPDDPDSFIRIVPNELARLVAERMQRFTTSLADLEVQVSTGRVVDFRAKDFLCENPSGDTAPLIWPGHLSHGLVRWPQQKRKKPNALEMRDETKDILVPADIYVLVKRFSAKEERRRIVAALYDPSHISASSVGFENHLNYYHCNGVGLTTNLAKGLVAYLNSTLLDNYFRQFNGHTQVNANDLRSLAYPTRAQLEALGSKIGETFPDQHILDTLIESELLPMANDASALHHTQAQKRKTEALAILKDIGLPREQQNERSALTLLALLHVEPDTPWFEAGNPRLRTRAIMDFIRDSYGKEYAANTRETLRKETLQPFVAAGIVKVNPDNPLRPTNSPNWSYQIRENALELFRSYDTDTWSENLRRYLALIKPLVSQYAQERTMNMIPIRLPSGEEFTLSPGGQNILIEKIINEFCPRFTPGGVLLYVGDTADKWGNKIGYFNKEALESLGVVTSIHGKMPDVVIHHAIKNWLVLIEAVSSRGPVDSKRRDELSTLFQSASAGLVFVTAFLNRREMVKHLNTISWETEVWVADAPTHMIHFNGERFLGPY
jgi:adenine-specific DNA-methyltransferase